MLRFTRSASGRRAECGVAAVEMAMLAPLLILLLLGGIETAWLLGQALDVRHAAREGGRLAAVDYGNTALIGAEVCAVMDNDDATTVQLAGSTGSLGDDIQVTVSKTPSHLTNFLSWAFPSSMTLDSTSTFALEVSSPSWTDGSYSCLP
jgi:Flp pilus assembly protein TadG